jgi:hypothetical protein
MCVVWWKPACEALCDAAAAVAQVGKIKDITQSGRTVKVQMAWFYRPEEAQGGRKVWAVMLGAHPGKVGYCCDWATAPQRSSLDCGAGIWGASRVMP